MKPEDIGRAYDQITHLWEREGFNRENGVVAHQKAFHFVENPGAALDVGCGCTGRFIDLMLENGFQPEGVDISAKMVELAITRHPEISFYLQDICVWSLPKKYSFITAWDSIWHVPLSEQAGVLKKLFSGLEKGGVCLFSAGGLEQAGEHENNAMGPTVYYSSLGVNGFLNIIENSGCQLKHFEFDQFPELHTFYIVQKE